LRRLYNLTTDRNMTKTVFNQSKVDFMKEPMFFGADGGVQRYDDFKYPQFDKLTQTHVGLLLETRGGKSYRRTGRTS
jgi:hypothetical protein